MSIFKRPKQEKVALDLKNPKNQKVAIKASLDNKVPIISKGDGIFLIDIKSVKQDRLFKFFKQFISESENCRQGIVDRDDPKCDYIVIFDLEKEE